ncbi:MAG: 1-acyl-sn-glycerol-3-phosphate acyltransferase, partial [Candidatus Eremiobacteraeota bacterium]|nr:1-acyl-sn-glycerol-3-phosphate acyltransferase [Candidatus Eremiobacteraeota bacterium]
DRQAGGTAALRASLRMLKEGRCVGIFPEGGRNVTGTNEEKAGAAFLAAASGAPVVPAAIVGTRTLRPFGRVTVVFGDPIRVVRNRQSDADDLEKGAMQIMQRIRALQESTS